MANETASDPPTDAATPSAARRFGPSRREATTFVELFALSGLVVAQPVFDIISKSAKHLAGVQIRTSDFAVFAGLVLLVPPVVLFTSELVVGLVIPRGRDIAHAVLVGLLVGVLINNATKSTFSFEERIPLGLLVIAAATYLTLRWPSARQWLRFLAIAPLVFAALFMLNPEVRDLMRAGNGSELAPKSPGPHPRVVIVAFDELPLASLLDGTGHIDAQEFPNFAAFAKTSTWYRNDTTVADHTLRAFPALLTGRFPSTRDVVPTAANYPQSLFTLLGSTYRMNVHEAVEEVCPSSVCSGNAYATKSGLSGLLEAGWRAGTAFNAPKKNGTANIGDLILPPAMQSADRFVASLKPSDQPALDYVHLMLPHKPWRYVGPKILDDEIPDKTYTTWASAAAALSARQRHLLTMQATDAVLGQVMDRLRAINAFDDSLIVVTADHGIAFADHEPERTATKGNDDQVLWTPLFVKTPGQTTATTTDETAHSIDVLPTIAKLVGVALPWPVDGRSLLEPTPAEAQVRAVLGDIGEPSSIAEFDRTAGFKKLIASSPWPASTDAATRFYRVGPYGGIVGHDVSTYRTVKDAQLQATAPGTGTVNGVVPDAQVIPWTVVRGTVFRSQPAGYLAVAVNGTVAGITPIEPAKNPVVGHFTALLLPSAFRAGRNDVKLYVVSGSTTAPVLESVTMTP